MAIKALRLLHIRAYHATVAEMTNILKVVGCPPEVVTICKKVVDTCPICRDWKRPGNKPVHSIA